MRTLAIALAVAGFSLIASAQEKLQHGAAVPVFNPQHVAGPHKGTNACPT
jgi:hypothetical protein